MERTTRDPAARERRSPTPAAARKREAIRRLKQGLTEDRFILHYQPIVRTSDGAVGAVEALLRWKDAADDAHDLSRLLRLVEQSPVIFRLQDWTLQQFLGDVASWPEADRAGVRINLNVSARVLPRSRLAGSVRRQLRATGVPARALALEITETSRIEELDTVADHLHDLVEMGIELWLDDFGTGYSSLEWLSRLPVHGVKIAGSFVERLGEKRCRSIVGHVITMAHDLGLRVAAEGIENTTQREFLVERGCDLLQGFLFHSAMPADELPRVLAGVPATGGGR